MYDMWVNEKSLTLFVHKILINFMLNCSSPMHLMTLFTSMSIILINMINILKFIKLTDV